MSAPHLLLLNRIEFDDKSTIGELLIDGIFQCNTLEDTVRNHKVAERTAIPSGRYELKLGVSGRFGFCPFVLNVPLFEDIRMHWGNTDADTRGCVLVGTYDRKAPDFIAGSKDAFGYLMRKLVRLEPDGLLLQIEGGLRIEEWQKAA